MAGGGRARGASWDHTCANRGLASLNRHDAKQVTQMMMTNRAGFMSHNEAGSHVQTSEVQLETRGVPVQHRPLQTGHFKGRNSKKNGKKGDGLIQKACFLLRDFLNITCIQQHTEHSRLVCAPEELSKSWIVLHYILHEPQFRPLRKANLTFRRLQPSPSKRTR